jgi:glycogen operon protein
MIDYLRGLGVTTLELMPVHAFVDDYRLVRNGLVNYWGYNSLGFFAPDRRYLASRDVAEFKTMVKALHAAGIEVLLDVVYNHTGETDHLGPTLAFRGIDNRSYYRLEADRRFYVNDAGTGNVFNVDHPRIRQLVLDSLRHWAENMHVDGFRFDLCPVLARVDGTFRADAPFLAAVAADPVLSRLKLVAEPWDLGPDGFRLGGFPPGWAEWNSRYRDAVRRFWRGDEGMLGELATRVAGSADLFEHEGRQPWSSVNFVAVHDGFTLHDLVSYERKHNEANLEGNRDGTDENFAWNCGVEGPTDDPAVLALRDRQKRNFLATLLLSLGTPMLQMGDECGRSQGGNNNAYCQDRPASWVDWENIRPADEALRALVRRLIDLRRRHPALTRRSFFRGAATPAGLKDITWLLPEGREPAASDWGDRARRCLGFLLAGASDGTAERTEGLLVLMNAGREDVMFRLSPLPADSVWEVMLDTAAAEGQAAARRLFSAGETFPLKAHSLALRAGRVGREARRSGRIQ